MDRIRRFAIMAGMTVFLIMAAGMFLFTGAGEVESEDGGEKLPAAQGEAFAAGAVQQPDIQTGGGTTEEAGGRAAGGTGSGAISEDAESGTGSPAAGAGDLEENGASQGGGASSDDAGTGGAASSGDEGTGGGGASSGDAGTGGGGASSGDEGTGGGAPSGDDGTGGGGSPGEGEEPQTPETDPPQWPQGQYVVKIQGASVKVPDGGRVYDGTDRIDVTFQTQIIRTEEKPQTPEEGEEGAEQPDMPDEEIPPYQVTCSARLERADAGERRVICDFHLQTEHPDHVKLDEATTHPDLRVTVKKAILSVCIPDGKKTYGDPADMQHIRLEGTQSVTVSGFVRDAAGAEMIPAGFEAPQVDVNPAVLEKMSPIYDTAAGIPGGSAPPVKEYAHALILKCDPAGHISGNPTGNYEFCSQMEDPRYTGGTVIIERAPAQRGKTYEVKGEKGAFVTGGRGEMIVRSGSALKVEPVSGQGYNTGAKCTGITSDGSFRFRLEMRDANGVLAADSEEEVIRYRADGSVPEANMQVGGASMSGGVYFCASSATVVIDAPADEISGLESVRYRILSGPMTADSVQAAMGSSSALTASSGWKEGVSGSRVSLNHEGIYAVEAQTQDAVGNTSLTRSQVVAIDPADPVIEITGVEDGSANASSVRIKAQCHDPSFLPGSLKAEMKADFGGIVPSSSVSNEASDGALLTFDDFPRRKEADAVYHLSVTAQDRAGNRTGKQISFSVNRFGSSYSLSDTTAAQLKSFYHTKPFDVTYIETNLDKVGDARVLLRSGGKLEELRTGSGLAVSESASQQGISRYAYTVSASHFTKDGTYEVMLLTTDRAGNSSDSTAQRLPVRFAIDQTAPECMVSGLAPEGRYQEKERTAVIEVRDNLALDAAQVFVDAGKRLSRSAKQLAEDGGIMKVTLPEKEAWQTVQVHVRDKAGNEFWTREIPVYISQNDPEKAKPYRSRRLSARQMESVRRYVEGIRKNLSRYGWFARSAHSPAASPGSVTNLHLRAMDQNLQPAMSQGGSMVRRTQEEAEKAGGSSPVFPAILIALALAAAMAGAGGYLYFCRFRIPDHR